MATEMQVTQLSDESWQGVTSAQLSWSGYREGTEMVSFRGDDGEWYACLRGIGPGGNFVESEDMGPYASRADAEEAAREAYAEDQRPAEDYSYE